MCCSACETLGVWVGYGMPDRAGRAGEGEPNARHVASHRMLPSFLGRGGSVLGHGACWVRERGFAGTENVLGDGTENAVAENVV